MTHPSQGTTPDVDLQVDAESWRFLVDAFERTDRDVKRMFGVKGHDGSEFLAYSTLFMVRELIKGNALDKAEKVTP